MTPLERALSRERHDGALGIAMRALGLPEELAPSSLSELRLCTERAPSSVVRRVWRQARE